MARKMTRKRIVLETLVVVGIFGVVHLPIYPQLHSGPEAVAEAPARVRAECPAPEGGDGAASPAAGTADDAPCPTPPETLN